MFKLNTNQLEGPMFKNNPVTHISAAIVILILGVIFVLVKGSSDEIAAAKTKMPATKKTAKKETQLAVLAIDAPSRFDARIIATGSDLAITQKILRLSCGTYTAQTVSFSFEGTGRTFLLLYDKRLKKTQRIPCSTIIDLGTISLQSTDVSVQSISPKPPKGSTYRIRVSTGKLEQTRGHSNLLCSHPRKKTHYNVQTKGFYTKKPVRLLIWEKGQNFATTYRCAKTL